MLAKLSHQYRQSISSALLVLMVLSVLQFCMMSMAEGQAMPPNDHHNLSGSHHEMADVLSLGEVDFANSNNAHDCCDSELTAHTMSSMEVACPDCEDTDQALQISSLPDLKPLFAFLYAVLQVSLNETLRTRHWQGFTEPEILTSLPEIYLAKASFLE